MTIDSLTFAIKETLKAPDKGAISISSLQHFIMMVIQKEHKPITFLKIKKKVATNELAISMGLEKKTSGTYSGSLNRLVNYGHLERKTINNLHNYTISKRGINELNRLNQVVQASSQYIIDQHNYSPS